MTGEMIFVLAMVVVAVTLFTTEKLPIDISALIVMAVLLLSGIVTPEEGIAGFSNTATVTVGAMFVISAGIFRTGSVNFIGSALARIGRRNFWLALLTMMLTIGGISAFINNTAAVAIFLPIVLGLARDINVSPSKLLMPLSFAAMFGGVCTLIGTSTNILVSSIAERHGERPFGMFEFSGFGLILFGAGTLYMILIGVRLIPTRRTGDDLKKSFGMGDYLTELVLQPEAKSIGVSLADSPLLQDLELSSVAVYREGTRLSLPASDIILRVNDLLRVRCDLENFRKLQERKGIVLKSDLLKPHHEKQNEVVLVEAVIAPYSVLNGKTLKQMQFRTVFGATAHAIRHRGVTMQENLETTTLQAGDVLLIEVNSDRLEHLKAHRAFVLVSEVPVAGFRKRKMFAALAIAGAAIAAAATGLVPIVVSAVAGSILLILTRCLTPDEAYEAIEWKIIFLMAGVLTLGTAMEKTGTAYLIADFLVNIVGDAGPTAVLSAFYLLTAVMTAVMSNNATVALLVPIAINAAESLGIEPRPLLIAVTFAASLDFMTPFGYQTNTIIYGPGRYKFVDYLRVGTPLNLLFWVLATVLIPIFWSF